MKSHSIYALVSIPPILAQVWVFHRVWAFFSCPMCWMSNTQIIALLTIILQALALFIFWVWCDVQFEEKDARQPGLPNGR